MTRDVLEDQLEVATFLIEFFQKRLMEENVRVGSRYYQLLWREYWSYKMARRRILRELQLME